MPANSTNTTPAAGSKTTEFGVSQAPGATAERSFADMEGVKASAAEAARRAERMIQDGIEALRAHSRVYVDAAGEQFDVAQRYVTDRVKERPVTATMAGVGVGLLLGLLLASSRNNHRSH